MKDISPSRRILKHQRRLPFFLASSDAYAKPTIDKAYDVPYYSRARNGGLDDTASKISNNSKNHPFCRRRFFFSGVLPFRQPHGVPSGRWRTDPDQGALRLERQSKIGTLRRMDPINIWTRVELQQSASPRQGIMTFAHHLITASEFAGNRFGMCVFSPSSKLTKGGGQLFCRATTGRRAKGKAAGE